MIYSLFCAVFDLFYRKAAEYKEMSLIPSKDS